MNNAALYCEANELQMKDAREFLEEAMAGGRLIPGRSSCRILDIGSGPGTITNSLIAQLVPQHATIVGGDISENMVLYANSKFANKRMKFKRLDIAHPHLDKVWTEEPFDKIFSFYCLHWVRDLRVAATNMYKLLKPGGDVLLVFLASHPVFTLYEELAKLPKWKTYMGDVQKYTSPYYKSEDPSREFTHVLEEAGFVNVSTNQKDTSYEYPSVKSVIKAMRAVNPFLDSIPEVMHTDYFDEVLRIIESRHLADIEPGSNRVRFEYRLVTARATRPYEADKIGNDIPIGTCMNRNFGP